MVAIILNPGWLFFRGGRLLEEIVSKHTAWNLRCRVHEKLVAFMQSKYPAALPKLRTAAPEPDAPVAKVVPANGPPGRGHGHESGERRAPSRIGARHRFTLESGHGA